nr:retrovirus-related Pol polyprotein from transposon TNT 1-94 [Tanacetum cinerariifolium]
MRPLDLIRPMWSATTATKGDTLLDSAELQEVKIPCKKKAQKGLCLRKYLLQQLWYHVMYLVVMIRVTKLEKVQTMHSWLTHLQNEQLTKDLKKLELMVLGYKSGLESVEERLKFFKTNDSVYIKHIKLLKIKIQMKDIAIKELRRKLEVALKEKEGIQLTVDKLENASKSLNKLIYCHIIDNCKKGLGYENYNAVPLPYIGNFMPPKPDLSYIGLDEFADKPVVSDDEKENVTQPKIVKKTVKPSIPKIELVKPRQQEKKAIKTVKKIMKKLMEDMLLLKVTSKEGKSVAKKGKQHRASCKNKTENSISQPLYLLHMDLFGLTFVKSLMKKMHCLVVIDDYSRFTWVFFLSTNDETSGILKSFITRIENLVDHKVKVIRCDNGTEFKNREMNQFCKIKGILRQYSVAKTPQQNEVAEMRNRILIKAARTMLADLNLPTTFWVEAVNTACYVQNRVLVVKPHNKTPYEFFHGRTPALSFMKPFGCSVTILNTLDHLGKFDGNADEGFFVGYSTNNKAFIVFNSRKRIVEENLHIRFSENTLML